MSQKRCSVVCLSKCLGACLPVSLSTMCKDKMGQEEFWIENLWDWHNRSFAQQMWHRISFCKKGILINPSLFLFGKPHMPEGGSSALHQCAYTHQAGIKELAEWWLHLGVKQRIPWCRLALTHIVHFASVTTWHYCMPPLLFHTWRQCTINLHYLHLKGLLPLQTELRSGSYYVTWLICAVPK